jgi:hypothetical protein
MLVSYENGNEVEIWINFQLEMSLNRQPNYLTS